MNAITNRQNAAHSTGPKTAAGKKAVSQNALKTGLTGQTVLLPTDDPEQYAAHLHRFTSLHNPVNAEQQKLVQSLADTEWRLLRIPRLEYEIYARGHQQFGSGLFTTWLHYERQLSNLMRHESRLRRQRKKLEMALNCKKGF